MSKSRRGLGRVYHPKYRDRKTREWRESPTWWIDYYVAGQKRRESSGSTNRMDAVGLLKKRVGNASMGRVDPRAAEKLTFTDLVEMLRSDYKINGRKSLKRAEVAIRSLTGFFGLFRALNITTDKITDYIKQRQEDGIKPATIHYDLSILKRMFTLAVRADRMDRRPYIPSIEVRNTRAHFFSEAEYQALLSQLPQEVKPVVEFLWLTGWRKTEVLTLQWRHVDWGSRVIRLDPGTTKNSDARTIPFVGYPELEQLLIRQRAATDSVQRAAMQVIPWVFHRNGRPIRDIRGAWDSACERANLSGRWLHDFRRSVVRRMEQRGVARSWAMALIGHRTESIYRRYAIVSEADLSQAVAKLSNSQIGASGKA